MLKLSKPYLFPKENIKLKDSTFGYKCMINKNKADLRSKTTKCIKYPIFRKAQPTSFPGGGKMRDPGNEVEAEPFFSRILP